MIDRDKHLSMNTESKKLQEGVVPAGAWAFAAAFSVVTLAFSLFMQQKGDRIFNGDKYKY